ncbi:MAG: ERCC4 domain-containing protein [Treponema sp.]|nr:ERCC4 domain-containing protein [Treponema sp.]
MILLEDSRQQAGKHKNVEIYCKRHGIELIRQKLDVGDYMIPDGRISVDTKQDLLELSKDVMSSDHRRFRAECRRAADMGIRLIILVEEVPPFGRVELWDVPRWKTSSAYHRYGDPMTLVNPATLCKALNTMTERYGVVFRFCHRRQTPSRIIKYLKGVYK